MNQLRTCRYVKDIMTVKFELRTQGVSYINHLIKWRRNTLCQLNSGGEMRNITKQKSEISGR